MSSVFSEIPVTHLEQQLEDKVFEKLRRCGLDLRQELRRETGPHFQMRPVESFLGADRLLLAYRDFADRLWGVCLRGPKCDKFRVLLQEGNIDVRRWRFQDIVASRRNLKMSPAGRN